MFRLTSVLVVLPAIILSLFSLTMLSSIAPAKLLLQLIYLIFSMLIGWGVWRVGIKNWLLLGKPLYILIIVLLVATLAIGKVTRGSTRWIQIGPLRLQASELAKPVLLVFGAQMLSANWPDKKRQQLSRLAKFMTAILIPVLLVLLQPDLGTAAIIMFVALSLIFYSGVPIWLMLFMIVTAVGLAPLSKYFLADYQIHRIEVFLDPSLDPRGSGYNVIQSAIAVGSGQMFGRGLGRGSQSQLKFLPERQTDFIFASLVEELGAISGIAVIGLYTCMVIGMALISLKQKKLPQFLVAAGCCGWFFFQAGINIGMNLGIAPVTGITLPFLSAGGSSLVASAVALGLIFSMED